MQQTLGKSDSNTGAQVNQWRSTEEYSNLFYVISRTTGDESKMDPAEIEGKLTRAEYRSRWTPCFNVKVSRGFNYHYYFSPPVSGKPMSLFLHGFPSNLQD